MERCKECYEDSIVTWRSLDYNAELREYAEGYISPVKYHYEDLDSALAVWGQEIDDGTLA